MASAASLAAIALAEDVLAGRRELDDVATAIFGVGAAGDDALGLERVDDGDHRRAVDAQALGDLLLGGGLEAVDRQQYPEVACMDVERREHLDMQLGHQPLGVLEQVGQPPARVRSGFSPLVDIDPSLSLG